MTFAFVSGHVALDFAGTVHHRRTDARDLLVAPDDLSRWMTEAGIVGTPVPVNDSELALAVRLREAIYRLACAAYGHITYGAPDCRLVNKMAANTPVRVQLTVGGSVSRVGDVDAVLATVSRSAVELLSGSLARDIKECLGEQCTRLYVDSSRHGSRRWCDMRRCGNRAKAATFRARHTS